MYTSLSSYVNLEVGKVSPASFYVNLGWQLCPPSPTSMSNLEIKACRPPPFFSSYVNIRRLWQVLAIIALRL